MAVVDAAKRGEGGRSQHLHYYGQDNELKAFAVVAIDALMVVDAAVGVAVYI